MADWTDITNTQVEPKAPVTSELMNALRDNPTASAEGADGAPRTQAPGLAVNVLTLKTTGSSNPTAEFKATSENVLTNMVWQVIVTTHDGTYSGDFSYQTSTNGGSSYGSETTLAGTAATGVDAGNVTLPADTNAVKITTNTVTAGSLEALFVGHFFGASA